MKYRALNRSFIFLLGFDSEKSRIFSRSYMTFTLVILKIEGLFGRMIVVKIGGLVLYKIGTH